MITLNWIGAVLVIIGVLYAARSAIFRGRMSNPHSSPTATRTLEPKHSGIRAFGLKANWPAVVLIVLGVVLLLFGSFEA